MNQNFQKPDKEALREQLAPEVFRITQENGTEPAGSSDLNKEYGAGLYVDVLSGTPLFSSKTKYDSGSGWPSFTAPIKKDVVTEQIDTHLAMPRTEIRATISDNHLGHVFDDGPIDAGGKRYCMNGAALEFIPKAEMEARGYGEYLDRV